MFTKIKAAWASLMARISHRIYTMGIEAELAAGVTKVETEFKAAVDEAKEAIETLIPAAAVAAAVSASTSSEESMRAFLADGPAPVASSAAPSDLTVIIGKVKAVLAVVDTVPAAFDTFAAPIIKAGGSDVDAALGKLAALLGLGNVKTAVWDEVVAAAKAL